jgi:hypothetical protein
MKDKARRRTGRKKRIDEGGREEVEAAEVPVCIRLSVHLSGRYVCLCFENMSGRKREKTLE